MGVVIGFLLQKGGVGKTTLTVNIAAEFAQRGLNSLIVDTNTQGQAATFLNAAKGRNMSELLIRHDREVDAYREFTPVSDLIVRNVRPSLDLLPSDESLTQAEHIVGAELGRLTIIRKRLGEVREDYRFVFIDLPPETTLTSTLALYACDALIAPVEPGRAAEEGIENVLRRMATLKRETGHAPELLGIVPNKVDTREKESGLLLKYLTEFAQQQGNPRLIGPTLHRNVRVTEATRAGQTMQEFAPDSRGAQDIQAITVWVAQRLQEMYV